MANSIDTQEKKPSQTVLIGITGCIAAYKACEVIRGLQKRGLDVKVVMTEHAAKFVGPTTFRALTGHEVALELFDEPGDPVHHISLAKEADVFCIVPATANVIAKISAGIADDLLTTTALATKASILLAPAMNSGMWSNPQTQANVRHCQELGMQVIAPGDGYLACGDTGAGRLEEPTVIVDAIVSALQKKQDLVGKRILITAGPTQEPLDPVRYLSNGSSGIQGYAVAQEAVRRGAQVTLVSGPVGLSTPQGVDVIKVRTALEMLDACEEPIAHADAAVFVAAVSDWRPVSTSASKIKHDGKNLQVDFVPNPDIAATLGASKNDGVFSVVFAAETENPIAAAKEKLVKKNADLVVANDVSNPELGMGSSDNHVWFVSKDATEELETMSKTAIATRILDNVAMALCAD